MTVSFRHDPLAPDPEPVVSASQDSVLTAILDEFTARWNEGSDPQPRAEEYLDRLRPDQPDEAVALIYQEYCLARSAGRTLDPDDYLARFPAQRDSLSRLFLLHDALSSRDRECRPDCVDLPDVGDEIGPYRLDRVLGAGAFARVFLARQTDLEDRWVVVKVTTKITPEHRWLARARHPHIVEILTHGTTEDGAVQLLVMPFLGGASLASVLAERRRQGRRTRTGRDLLADLDRVAAPEYDAGREARPNRDLLESLSYPQALAWIFARLAEALDHAYRRGVVHGDLKPSNILLTADGTPMLLDFNLAVAWNWNTPGTQPDTETAGGTLAYLAPERLRSFAAPRPGLSPRPLDRHRADLYALGVVLRETLTGRLPEVRHLQGRSLSELASSALKSLESQAATPLRAPRGAIPAGLRPILDRCLALDPADRYQTARELAEDLDRWREHRAPTYAPEPAPHHVWVRWARRHRRALGLALAGLGLMLGIAAWWLEREAAQRRAEANLSQYWDSAEWGVFPFRRQDRERVIGQGDPTTLAHRHLVRFEVDEPVDFRQRADVRDLPPRWRDELEVWLLEQTWRYGRGMVESRDPDEDTRRGLVLLERVTASNPLTPLVTLCLQLRAKLKVPIDPGSTPLGPSSSTWMEDYLRGVAAEDQQPREALTHYERVVRVRPNAFWGHYRAAAVAYRLGASSAAVRHLHWCAGLRPRNAALQVQLAGCHAQLDQIDQALACCDRALALDPNLAETYFSRSQIRHRTGQPELKREDLDRFALLVRKQGKQSLAKLKLDLLLGWGLSGDRREMANTINLLRRILDLDAEDLDARQALVHVLIQSGDHREALHEVSLLLDRRPDHLWARFTRCNLYLILGKPVRVGVVLVVGARFTRCDVTLRLAPPNRTEARADLDYLLRHPRFEEFAQEHHLAAIQALLDSSWFQLKDQNIPRALEYAQHALTRSLQFQLLEGESHYCLGRAYTAAGGRDREQYTHAVDHLRQAIALKPSLRRWFNGDPLFQPIRSRLESPPLAEGGSRP